MTPCDAALSYAGRGLHIFPCVWIEDRACSCRDPECDSPGKHPLTPHGLLDATNDPAVVRDFWTKFPKANIAIATGKESGIVAVDIDDVEVGKPELEKLLPGYDFKSLPLQKTGKGWHLIFGHPGVPVKSATKFLPGIDSRGDGVTSWPHRPGIYPEDIMNGNWSSRGMWRHYQRRSCLRSTDLHPMATGKSRGSIRLKLLKAFQKASSGLRYSDFPPSCGMPMCHTISRKNLSSKQPEIVSRLYQSGKL
jgi:hypothetical protein